MNILETIENEISSNHARQELEMKPGDTVRVHVNITEGSKSRIQIFEGTVIRIKSRGPGSTFTVRKVSSGVGVERIFPLYSPNVKKVDVVARHKVRRAKLHFLRSRQGKSARLKPIRDFNRKKKQA
jgi:large subunit ribosomal protein L19